MVKQFRSKYMSQNANGGGFSRVDAQNGHFFDRAAFANGCASGGGGGGGGVSDVVFHELQDARIAAKRFFTEKELSVVKVFTVA
jgi:hypothetical protein